MRKVIQMSQRQISGNGEEKSMSLQEVFLVNHSPSQAKERERMITAISGLTCSGPYMRSGPIGSLVSFNPRTRKGCNLVFSHCLARITMFQPTYLSGIRLSIREMSVVLFAFQPTYPSGIRQYCTFPHAIEFLFQPTYP